MLELDTTFNPVISGLVVCCLECRWDPSGVSPPLSVSAAAGSEWTACPARVVSVRDGLSEHGRDVEVRTAGNNRGYQVALVDLGQENVIGQVLHKVDQQLQLPPRIWEMESEDDCQWACREICGGLQSMESRHTTRSDDIDGFCSFRAFLYICN